MEPFLLHLLLLYCTCFLGYSNASSQPAESIPPITSVSLPPIPTSKSLNDYLSLIMNLETEDWLTGPLTGFESNAVLTPPPAAVMSSRVCTHLSHCSWLAVNPSLVGTVQGPDYPVSFDKDALISEISKITKGLAITTDHDRTTSLPPSKTLKAATTSVKPHPYTTTLSDWNVVVCDSYTTVGGSRSGHKSTSCLGTPSTITSIKAQVAMQMKATPANFGTMSSTDIYTSISSALMVACKESAVETTVVLPHMQNGPVAPTPFSSTMSACHKGEITIASVDGPVEPTGGRFQKGSGHVILAPGDNYFDEGHLEELVNITAHTVAESAATNPTNVSFTSIAWDWFGVEISNYEEAIYLANSTLLLWYDPGFAEATQSFTTFFAQWGVDFPLNNSVCENIAGVAKSVTAEVPVLEKDVDFTLNMCNALV